MISQVQLLAILLSTSFLCCHAQPSCTAETLEALEIEVGLEIINAQEKNSVTQKIVGEDVFLTTDNIFEVIDCAAKYAISCSVNRFTLINDLTGHILFERIYTPGCRPNDCIDNDAYGEALIQRVNAAGPSSVYWYSKNDIVSKQCEGTNDCTMVIFHCGVRIEVPYERELLLTQQAHKEKLGALNPAALEQINAKETDDDSSSVVIEPVGSTDDDASAVEVHVSDTGGSSSAALPIILGALATAAVVAILGAAFYYKSQHKENTEAEFFTQYE